MHHEPVTHKRGVWLSPRECEELFAALAAIDDDTALTICQELSVVESRTTRIPRSAMAKALGVSPESVQLKLSAEELKYLAEHPSTPIGIRQKFS